MVRTLLGRGADPNVGDKEWNALRFALLTREDLLEGAPGGEEAAETERRKALAFFEATRKGRAEAARLLREAGARKRWE